MKALRHLKGINMTVHVNNGAKQPNIKFTATSGH
jgi:hypothetical protein